MPPGYRPADLLEDPVLFGYDSNAPWKSAPETREAQLAVARLQHRLACTIRKDHPDNPARYLATRLGAPDRVDYLRRKLNGQIPITLTELFEWLHALGPETATAVGMNPKLVFHGQTKAT